MPISINAEFRPARHHPEFELSRHIPQPAATVWNALITPDRLAEWIGVEWLSDRAPLSEGSEICCRFPNSEIFRRGLISKIGPGYFLEHGWYEDLPGTLIQWRLLPERDGCLLSLTHRFGAPDDAPRFAAGWTGVLESLAKSFGDETAETDQGMQAWYRRRDHYARLFGPRATLDGRQFKADAAPALRFDRQISGSVDEAWSALTDPEILIRWQLARPTAAPEAGGRYLLELHGQGLFEGFASGWEPRTALELTRTRGPENREGSVRFELMADGNECRLVLTHTVPKDENLASIASSWHWHLDALGKVIDGETYAYSEARRDALHRMYAATL